MRRACPCLCIQMYITYPALARAMPKPVGRAVMPFTDRVLFLHSEEIHRSPGQRGRRRRKDTDSQGIVGQLISYIKETRAPVSPSPPSSPSLSRWWQVAA